MQDIVLVAGNNQLNVAMTPIALAQFVYASDIRYEYTSIYWAGADRPGIKFEVDIKNTGNIGGSCTAIATIETCYGANLVNMGTQSIAPGEVKTFSGQWYWGYGVALEPDEWWRPGYITSEAGKIYFGLPRTAGPNLISINIPTAKAAHEFMPSATLNLPSAPDKGYTFIAYIPVVNMPSAYRNLTLMGWQFIPPAVRTYLNFKTKYLPLDRTDNQYTVKGTLTYLGDPRMDITDNWGAGPSLPLYEKKRNREYADWRWLPAGTYPVYATITVFTIAVDETKAEGALTTTAPSYTFEFGQVGILNLQLSDWFEMSNFRYPASATRGTSFTISIDVTNTGVASGTREVECRTDIPANAGPPYYGQLKFWQDVSLSPGQKKTVSFSIPLAIDWAYTTVHVSISIEGFGGVSARIAAV